jgi:hypothetical protein
MPPIFFSPVLTQINNVSKTPIYQFIVVTQQVITRFVLGVEHGKFDLVAFFAEIGFRVKVFGGEFLKFFYDLVEFLVFTDVYRLFEIV